MQKLSSRRPSLESRLKVLKEISAEIGITLHLEEDVLAAVKVWKFACFGTFQKLLYVSSLNEYFL